MGCSPVALSNKCALRDRVAVVHGYAFWLRERWQAAIATFCVAIVWFRCDMIILAGPIVLSMLCTRTASFLAVLKWGLLCVAACLAITVSVDSIMWRRLLWPEGVVLRFNTAENKSSLWGTFL